MRERYPRSGFAYLVTLVAVVVATMLILRSIVNFTRF
jgi:hypothetical protein